MTDYNKKARAVVLAALMVFSVFAGTVALSGTAAAEATDLSNASASDVIVGADATTQTVSVEVTVTDGGTDNISFDHGAPGYTVEGLDSATISSSSGLEINNSSTTGASTVEVGLNDTTNDGNTASGTVEIQVTVDTVGVATSTGNTITIDDAQGTASAQTPNFAFVSGGGDNNRAGNADGTGDFNTADGEGYIFPGATIFQGESDVFLGDNFDGTPTKVAGNDEGVPLETPNIPQSQSTGRYSDNGNNNVTVQTPRVTTLDVLNSNLNDIAGGSVAEGTSPSSGSDGSGAGNLTVIGAWNYQNAED
ncbi:surface glycoprotein, partial [Haloplanus salinarum]